MNPLFEKAVILDFVTSAQLINTEKNPCFWTQPHCVLCWNSLQSTAKMSVLCYCSAHCQERTMPRGDSMTMSGKQEETFQILLLFVLIFKKIGRCTFKQPTFTEMKSSFL